MNLKITGLCVLSLLYMTGCTPLLMKQDNKYHSIANVEVQANLPNNGKTYMMDLLNDASEEYIESYRPYYTYKQKEFKSNNLEAEINFYDSNHTKTSAMMATIEANKNIDEVKMRLSINKIVSQIIVYIMRKEQTAQPHTKAVKKPPKRIDQEPVKKSIKTNDYYTLPPL